MFSQFKQLLKEYGDKLVMQSPHVPERHKKAAMNEARKSIQSGIEKFKSNGKLNQLAQMFKSGKMPDTEHSTIRRISEGFINALSQRFDVSKPTARTIAATLVLGVIGGLFATGVLMSNKANAQQKTTSGDFVAKRGETSRGSKKGHGKRAIAQGGALEGALKTTKHKYIRKRHGRAGKNTGVNEENLRDREGYAKRA